MRRPWKPGRPTMMFRTVPRTLASLTLAWALAGCDGKPSSNGDGPGPSPDASDPSPDASDPSPDASDPSPDASGGDASADTAPDQALPTQLGLVAALAPPMLHLLSLDATGTLTRRAVVPAPDAPMGVARSPDDRLVYVAGRKIAAFSVDRATAGLAAINDLDAALPNWTGLAVEPARQWLVVSDRMRGLRVLGLGLDGSLVTSPGAGTSAQIGDGVTFDPSGNFVFAASCDQDLVARYAWHGSTGALLSPATPVVRLGSGPKRVIFHQSGKTAYVMNIKEQSVTSFDYDTATGALAAPETISLPDPDFLPLVGYCGGGHLIVHPSGRLAYATTADNGGSVTIMAVAPSGRLTVVDYEHYFLFRGADPLAIDPTGTYLLVGNTAGALQVFRIDPADGRLTYVNSSVSGTTGLQFLPSTAG